MDFTDVRNIVFEKIRRTNLCTRISKAEQIKLKFESYEEVWKILTELSLPKGEVLSVSMYICFPYDFPVILPSIFLSKQDVVSIGPIPHVTPRGYVCIFDSETTVINYDKADGAYLITRQCLIKAKRIIEYGINNRSHADFRSELLAYWENLYNKRDCVETAVSLLENSNDDSKPIYCLQLKTSIAGYSLIFHVGGVKSIIIKQFLKDREIAYDEQEIQYLGEVYDIEPPFYWTNRSVVSFIKNNFCEKYDQYILHLKNKIPIVLFSTIIDGERIFLGWLHKTIKKNQKGFRPNFNKVVAMSESIAQMEPVIRIKLDSLDSSRLTIRTSGEIKSNFSKFAVIGLGSIGSHLIGLLNNSPVDEYRIVDTDILKIENINRHLLGFSYVGQLKSEAMRHYLIDQNPMTNVLSRSESIIKVIDKEVNFLEDLDAIIVCVGKYSVEHYLLTKLRNSNNKAPIFLLWVEPYSVAGHMLYIPAISMLDYSRLFDDSYYKFNLIDKFEYMKEENKFLLKEAGCQNSYVPYSGDFVVNFLANMVPEIDNLLKKPDSSSITFTYFGDISLSHNRGLALSKFWSDRKDERFIKTKLE